MTTRSPTRPTRHRPQPADPLERPPGATAPRATDYITVDPLERRLHLALAIYHTAQQALDRAAAVRMREELVQDIRRSLVTLGIDGPERDARGQFTMLGRLFDEYRHRWKVSDAMLWAKATAWRARVELELARAKETAA